jgi:hypothetical protein
MTIAQRTSPEVIAELRRRYLAVDEHGAPLEKLENIAIEVGLSVSVAKKYIADLPRRRPRDEKQRQSAIDMASLGVDVREIAERLKCPIATVLRALAPEPPTQEELEKARGEGLERARLEDNARRRALYAKRKAAA